MKYKGKLHGFSQRTFTEVRPSKFLPPELAPNEYWRSPVTQKLIKRDLFEFNNTSEMPDSKYFKLAVNETRLAFRLPQPVPMLHINDIFQEDLPIWSRSPGLPWKDIGYKTKDDIRKDPDAIRSIRKFWHLVKYGANIKAPDCCAFVRSHLAKYPDRKVRAIWGYPATMTFGEAVFALPLTQAYQKISSPLAYGYEVGNGGFRRVKNEFSPFKYYMGLDFTKFDKTVPAWLVEIAFCILIENVDLKHYRDHGVADIRCSWTMYEYIKDYFINTTIRLANGDRYQKDSGVASGSYFTQLVDSVINYLLITWFCMEQDLSINKMLVLGDDSLVGLPRRPDLDKMCKLAQSIGMDINLRKSCQSDDLNAIKFLGYRINDCRPMKDRNDWLAALYFPERPDEEWDDVASRALGLYYANQGVDHYMHNMLGALVRLKPFDLRMSANQEQELRMLGIQVDKTLPSAYEFMQRLGSRRLAV